LEQQGAPLRAGVEGCFLGIDAVEQELAALCRFVACQRQADGLQRA
jgi:hypothetical protein